MAPFTLPALAASLLCTVLNFLRGMVDGAGEGEALRQVLPCRSGDSKPAPTKPNTRWQLQGGGLGHAATRSTSLRAESSGGNYVITNKMTSDTNRFLHSSFAIRTWASSPRLGPVGCSEAHAQMRVRLWSSYHEALCTFLIYTIFKNGSFEG